MTKVLITIKDDQDEAGYDLIWEFEEMGTPDELHHIFLIRAMIDLGFNTKGFLTPEQIEAVHNRADANIDNIGSFLEHEGRFRPLIIITNTDAEEKHL